MAIIPHLLFLYCVFTCEGCTSLKSPPVKLETLNPMPRVKRVPRSFQLKNPYNNKFEGSVGGLLQGKISVSIQYTLIFQWQSKFPRPSSRTVSITVPIVSIILTLFSSCTGKNYLPLDVKHLAINNQLS